MPRIFARRTGARILEDGSRVEITPCRPRASPPKRMTNREAGRRDLQSRLTSTPVFGGNAQIPLRKPSSIPPDGEARSASGRVERVAWAAPGPPCRALCGQHIFGSTLIGLCPHSSSPNETATTGTVRSPDRLWLATRMGYVTAAAFSKLFHRHHGRYRVARGSDGVRRQGDVGWQKSPI